MKVEKCDFSVLRSFTVLLALPAWSTSKLSVKMKLLLCHVAQ